MTTKEAKEILKEAEWQQEAFHRISGKLSEKMIDALKYLLNGA
jgi:hypothetical protein